MATNDGTLLSPSDVAILKQVIDLQRRGLLNTRGRPAVIEADPAPPTFYLARTPRGGIPPMLGEYPGQATCEIYKLTYPNATASPEIVPSHSKDVYNISECGIPAETWIKVLRDEYGDWYTVFDGCRDENSSGSVTGTGTGPCEEVSYEVSEYRCENGLLKKYVREIIHNIDNGCLTQTIGDWVYDRIVGTCGLTIIHEENIFNVLNQDCSNLILGQYVFNSYYGSFYIYMGACTFFDICQCRYIGLGTSTSSSTAVGCDVPLVCHYCGMLTPNVWYVYVNGFSGNGTCAMYNGYWQLSQVNNCEWSYRHSSGIEVHLYVTATSIVLTFFLHVLTPGYIADPTNGAVYQAAFLGDCCTGYTLEQVVSECPLNPVTIEAIPYCCLTNTGTGTGTIGGGTMGTGSGGGGGCVQCLSCCPLTSIPTVLYGHVSDRTGACTCMTTLTITFTYQYDTILGETWTASLPGCPNPSGITLYCDGQEWTMRGTNLSTGTHPQTVICGVDTLTLIFENLDGSGICLGVGTFDLTINTTP